MIDDLYLELVHDAALNRQAAGDSRCHTGQQQAARHLDTVGIHRGHGVKAIAAVIAGIGETQGRDRIRRQQCFGLIRARSDIDLIRRNIAIRSSPANGGQAVADPIDLQFGHRQQAGIEVSRIGQV